MRTGVLLLVLYSLLSWCGPAFAQGTIEVVGDGTGTGKVAAVKLLFRLTASERATADAVRSFKAKRSKALKALSELEVEGMTIVGQGPAFKTHNPADNPFGRWPQNQEEAGTQVRVDEQVVVRVPWEGVDGSVGLVDRLDQIVDTGLDVGMKMESSVDASLTIYAMQNPNYVAPAFMVLEVEDGTGLQKAASDAAFADGKRQASDLAKLAGVKITGVQSVKVESATTPVFVGGDLSQATVSTRLRLVFTTEAVK